ncbi:hypothetical protein [Elizabethkingia sp. JS20170427COW]|uniref:hypothetical protein n=1 Tax=Elizabethkingia sp. JS20170427COW TaxID=2583851 RepID=UPI0011102AE6|nr:hypothetical protein [Elizabethkingia sp. JS20170427COW]QCX54313.1 hypothetical protein FGE20_11465 [Elizabethkingia sp. JS20170427COW]
MKKRFILFLENLDTCQNLLLYAGEWSKRSGAELLLFTQTNIMVPAFAEAQDKLHIVNKVNEQALASLKQLSSKILSKNIKVDYHVSELSFPLYYNKIETTEYQDLIFIGIKEIGILRKLFFGNIAIQLVERIGNTLVALPQEISVFCQEKIFVAVSDKVTINILELTKFLNFIDGKKCNITFFHLAKSGEDTSSVEMKLRELSNLFSEKYNTDIAVFEGRDLLNNIDNIIENAHREMLIVQKGSRLISDHLFRKFLVNDLINVARVPLVVLP